MAIPSQVEMYKIVLEIMSDGGSYTRRQIKQMMPDVIGMTEEDRQEQTSSGVPTYESRSSWAVSWLYDAGLIYKNGKGVYTIADKGRTALAQNIDYKDLARQLREAKIAKQRDSETSVVEFTSEEGTVLDEKSPIEIIDAAANEMRSNLRAEILQNIMSLPGRDGDTFFEKIVTDLLVKMGYGEGRVTQASNDYGIDGVIKTDPLGFNPILIQAKRCSEDNTIGREAIQKFAGALGAVTRGAFITTSKFTKTAIECAKSYPHADIVLIDGDKLTDLMIQYNLGVSTDKVIEIKRIDSDYFEQ